MSDTVRLRLQSSKQEKSRVALCRNCECRRFIVKSAGKSGHLRGVARTPGRRPADDDPLPKRRKPSGQLNAATVYPKGQHLLPAGRCRRTTTIKAVKYYSIQAAEWCHHLQMHFCKHSWRQSNLTAPKATADPGRHGDPSARQGIASFPAADFGTPEAGKSWCSLKSEIAQTNLSVPCPTCGAEPKQKAH